MSYFDINLDLSWEEKEIKSTAHRFAKEVLRPVSIQLDKMSAEEAIAQDSPLWGALQQCYAMGYHKALLPESVGGGGFSPLQAHILLEEMLWGSMGISTTLFLSTWVFNTLLAMGDDRLIQEFVIPFCECEDASIRGCWGIIEPDHGSDILLTDEEYFSKPGVRGQVRAYLDGDEWVLNGQKAAWVSASPIATHCKLNLQIDDSLGLSGGGVCIVPLHLPGVSKGKPLEKLGQRDLSNGEIFFEDVRIPKHYMFVEPDQYAQSIKTNLGFGNSFMSVMALGIARACFDESFEYAQQRIQGGKALAEHSSMKIRLHKMFSKVEAIRAFSRAVWNLNSSIYPPLSEYAYAAKTYCTEATVDIAYEAVQIHGANGITKEYPVEKFYRDARLLTIEDGENTTLNRAGGAILNNTYPRTEVQKTI